MTGVNKVILVGNVGKNPDVVTFPSDGAAPVKKASFPLATTEYRRNRDSERVEITEWWPTTSYFSPTASAVKVRTGTTTLLLTF